MSKLFDQLKAAARSREEKPSGILIDAMRKRYGRDPPHLVSWGTPVEELADEAKPQAPAAPPPRTRISQFSGVGLALLIFIVAVLAWRSAPFTPPRKHKIDPSELRIDRTLDLGRVSPKGTSPPGGPS